MMTKVTDGSVTTYHFGPVPTEEDCGCELGTPVQQTRRGAVCTGCGEEVDQ